MVDLGTNRTAISVSAGNDFTCANLDNGEIKCWDTSGVTNMSFLFSYYDRDYTAGGGYCAGDAALNFDEDLSLWDVSSATTMESMFDGASSFNSDISK